MCQEYCEKSIGGGYSIPHFGATSILWGEAEKSKRRKVFHVRWKKKREKRERKERPLRQQTLKRRLDASRTASAYTTLECVGEKEASHIRLQPKTQARAQEYLHSYVSSRMWEEFAVCFLADFLGAFQVSTWREDDFLRPSRRFLGTPLWGIITGSALLFIRLR